MSTKLELSPELTPYYGQPAFPTVADDIRSIQSRNAFGFLSIMQTVEIKAIDAQEARSNADHLLVRGLGHIATGATGFGHELDSTIYTLFHDGETRPPQPETYALADTAHQDLGALAA